MQLVGPQAGVEHRVGVDDVDPDAVGAPLERGHPGELRQRRLRRRVGGRARCPGPGRSSSRRRRRAPPRGRPAQERVRGPQQQGGAASTLTAMRPLASRPGASSATGCPVGEDAGVEHQQVEPAEASAPPRATHSRRAAPAPVTSPATPSERRAGRDLVDRGVEVEPDHRRPAAEQRERRRPGRCPTRRRSPARPGRSSGSGAGWRAQLGLLQLPVLDVEQVGARQTRGSRRGPRPRSITPMVWS